MSFSISPATRGNLASRSPSMPSFAPLTSHCRRGTNTKSAMEGFSVFASHPVAESASSVSRNRRCRGSTSSFRSFRTLAL